MAQITPVRQLVHNQLGCTVSDDVFMNALSRAMQKLSWIVKREGDEGRLNASYIAQLTAEQIEASAFENYCRTQREEKRHTAEAVHPNNTIILTEFAGIVKEVAHHYY